MGGAESQADHQRQSFGRAGLPERSHEIQHAALGAGACRSKASAGVVGVSGALSRRSAMPSPPTTCAFCWPSASKMALAIENALKYQQAESSADHRLPHRPAQRALAVPATRSRNWRAASATNSTLTVMVCDMDGFKQINDRFGHLEGNRVLRLFAQALQGSLPRIRLRGAHGRRRIRRHRSRPDRRRRRRRRPSRCATSPGRSGRKSVRKTSCRSAWAARCIREDGLDAEELLAEADRRMYLEKQQQLQRKNAARIRA